MRRLNPLDWFLIGFGLLLVMGLVLVQRGVVRTSPQQQLGETPVRVTVLLSHLRTTRQNLFTPGESLSITVRNQPRGKVKIESVDWEQSKVVTGQQGGKAVGTEDLSQKYSYDVTLGLRDRAMKSPDGYVAEGVKLKIGMPIEVEGFDYRVNGYLVNIEPVTASEAAAPRNGAASH